MNNEVLEIISSTQFGALATLLEDGSPYATPITYTFKDGRFTWWSAPTAVHSLNIVRDGRVSFTIIEKVIEGQPRAVYINGTASATGETQFNEQWQQDLAQYLIELGQPDEEKSSPGRFYFKGNKK